MAFNGFLCSSHAQWYCHLQKLKLHNRKHNEDTVAFVDRHVIFGKCSAKQLHNKDTKKETENIKCNQNRTLLLWKSDWCGETSVNIVLQPADLMTLLIQICFFSFADILQCWTCAQQNCWKTNKCGIAVMWGFRWRAFKPQLILSLSQTSECIMARERKRIVGIENFSIALAEVPTHTVHSWSESGLR